MNVLLVGGTAFVGPHVVRLLLDVTVFTRGQATTQLPLAVTRITGQRQDLPAFVSQFKTLAPDVVVDMIPFRQEDAHTLMQTFKGLCRRVIGLSSIDVYQAYGRLKRTEPGPLQSVPLTETAALRQTKAPHGLGYDKTGIEQEIMGQPDLPGTILRLPAIHGPGDYQHRLYRYLKRMDDGRPAILLNSDFARWRFSRGYVENMAAAVALAVDDERAAGRIYNVAEPEAFPEAEWVRTIGRTVGWQGKVLVTGNEDHPIEDDLRQDWAVDTYRIRHELGYHEIVSRSKSLERTIAWERENPPTDLPPEAFDYAAEDKTIKKLTGG